MEWGPDGDSTCPWRFAPSTFAITFSASRAFGVGFDIPPIVRFLRLLLQTKLWPCHLRDESVPVVVAILQSGISVIFRISCAHVCLSSDFTPPNTFCFYSRVCASEFVFLSCFCA